MISDETKYLAYISRAKVHELFDQWGVYSVENGAETNHRYRGASEDGITQLFNLIRSGISFGGRFNTVSTTIEIVKDTGIMPMLGAVVDHIECRERVRNLSDTSNIHELIDSSPFAFTYSGSFCSKNLLETRRIFAENEFLRGHAKEENRFAELGYDQLSIMSDMCILASSVSEYTLCLVCSYKYFSDMGWSREEHRGAMNIHPHALNYPFFSGDFDTSLDAIFFLVGMSGMTIFGTPLLLTHQARRTLPI